MKWLSLLACSGLLLAQSATQANLDQQQDELTRLINETAASPIDLIHGLEAHLKKYPASLQRLGIEKALTKASIEAGDRQRIVRYGEKILAAEPANNDLQLIDRVIRSLLENSDAASAKEALPLCARYLRGVEALAGETSRGHLSAAQWEEEVNRGRSRAMVLQARATGNAGDAEPALQLATKSWDISPNAEAAREVAKWLLKLHREAQAIDYLADAFAMEDARATEAERALDRQHLGENYTKLHGSEKGLGDVILAAYDRTSAAHAEHLAKLRQQDPNIGLTAISEFTLAPVGQGTPLPLASLKGKTVVMDFWATWCGPCRVQHPLIDKVSKRYVNDPKVVFLSVNSDEDPTLVLPFLKEIKWGGANYIESGLARLLTVNSIPTVLILGPDGKISSRMAGFIPERFEDMLVQRIEESRVN